MTKVNSVPSVINYSVIQSFLFGYSLTLTSTLFFKPINPFGILFIEKFTIMKKILLTAILLSTAIIFKANAQVTISANINIGNQPMWGPSGYDHVDYYYLPDVDMYYYVPTQQFVYFQNNQWVFNSNLPYACRNFDLYNSYKVVVNEPRPYMNNAYYRTRYASYRNWNRPQPMWRDYPNRGNYGRYQNQYPVRKDVYGSADYNKGGRGNDNWGNDNGRRGNGKWDRNNDQGNNGNRNHDNGRRGNDNRDNRRF